MERKNYILIILLALLFSSYAGASYKSRIYNAFIDGQMTDWKNVIDKMESANNPDAGFLAELVNYQYGYIGWCLGNDREDEAEQYLEMAEENLSTLEKQGYDESFISAYTSAFYGFKIGLSSIKAPFIGPKSVKYAEKAMEQDPSNPMGYIEFGNSQYYMPAIFGGSKNTAIDYYEKALELMEENPEYKNNNWNYLNLLVTLANACTEIYKYDKADDYYKKALKTEPDFKWVRDELYPEFLKQKK